MDYSKTNGENPVLCQLPYLLCVIDHKPFKKTCKHQLKPSERTENISIIHYPPEQAHLEGA